MVIVSWRAIYCTNIFAAVWYSLSYKKLARHNFTGFIGVYSNGRMSFIVWLLSDAWCSLLSV